MKKIIVGLAILLLSACSHSNGLSGPPAGFPKATKPYPPEQAIQNGDVVNVHGKYSNMDKWQQFMNNVEARKDDAVRITQYTTEGDPIFYELVYDGETIVFTFDNSMDAFGVNQRRPSASCENIGTKKNEQGQEYYTLTDCDKDTGDLFWFGKE